MILGHERAVLQFSGGRDSLACLQLLKPHWHELEVHWCYTHDQPPEVLAQMRDVAGLVRNFVIVHSDQPGQTERFGPPTDLLPVWDTELGRECDETRTRKFQSPFACCSENLWKPLEAALVLSKATLCIRGQRNSEAKKGTVRSGEIHAGIEYWFPLENWAEKEVLAYLREEGVPLPAHYSWFNSSLDCMTCTAYLVENRGKAAYLAEKHPEAARRLKERLRQIKVAVMLETAHIHDALEELNAA